MPAVGLRLACGHLASLAQHAELSPPQSPRRSRGVREERWATCRVSPWRRSASGPERGLAACDESPDDARPLHAPVHLRCWRLVWVLSQRARGRGRPGWPGRSHRGRPRRRRVRWDRGGPGALRPALGQTLRRRPPAAGWDSGGSCLARGGSVPCSAAARCSLRAGPTRDQVVSRWSRDCLPMRRRDYHFREGLPGWLASLRRNGDIWHLEVRGLGGSRGSSRRMLHQAHVNGVEEPVFEHRDPRTKFVIFFFQRHLLPPLPRERLHRSFLQCFFLLFLLGKSIPQLRDNTVPRVRAVVLHLLVRPRTKNLHTSSFVAGLVWPSKIRAKGVRGVGRHSHW